MIRTPSFIHSSALGALVFTALLAGPALAQPAAAPTPPGVTVKTLQAVGLSDTSGKQAVLNAVTLEPGAAITPHVHPGDCIGSVIDGTVDLLVEGREPRRMTAGDSFVNPRGLAHQFRNAGTTTAKLLNTVVADRGVPPTVPASLPSAR